MNFLGLKSLFVILTICVMLLQTRHVTSTVIEDVNHDISWKNCSLNFTSKIEHRHFNTTVLNNRLIKLSINLTWTDIPQKASRNNTDITKSTWFLANEEAGKDLLLLDDQFEVMSLGTLAISVGDVALTLNQIPENCLAEVSEHQAIESISGFLLKAVLPQPVNDQNDEDKADNKYVCNGTIKGSGICCLSNDQGIITCMKLEENEWTNKFLIFVIILSLIIISQSGRLIPKSFYHDRYVEQRNIHRPLVLNIEMTREPTHRRLVKIAGDDNYKNVKSFFRDGQQVSFFRDGQQVSINAVHLFLDDERFESQASNTSAFNNVFHDCVHMFNDIFCKCNEDYSDFEGLKECCYYDLLHMCYIFFMKIIIVVIFISPLAIRLVFLNNFITTDLKDKLQMNCKLITYCFSVAFLTIAALSTRSLRKYRSKFIIKLKRSMDQAMAENMNTGMKRAGEALKRFFRTSNSILYSKRFSRVSLVKAWLAIVIIWMPLSILRSCFHICFAAFPLINFLNRTLFEYMYLSLELAKEFSSRSLCFVTTIVFIPLIILHLTITALILLFTDAAKFFAQCCLYMTIGFLLNFDNLLVYLSFFVLISTYIFQCIRKVNTKIRNFNKELINVLSNISDTLGNQDTLNGTIVLKRNGIFFRTSQMSYFFKQNKNDKVKYLHVSRSFLNYLSSIPSPMTPGSRNWLYCKAFMEIVLMFLLLALVVVIVVSYGNATDLSTGMKTLITLGSGALLFFFNNLLIKSFSHSKFEDDELLENFIRSHVGDDFKEIWEIKDFESLSTDNRASNPNLYCKYTNEHEIEFFTKEPPITAEYAEPMSVCKVLCNTVCLSCLSCLSEIKKSHETNNHETNTNQMTNEVHADTERTILLHGNGDHRIQYV